MESTKKPTWITIALHLGTEEPKHSDYRWITAIMFIIIIVTMLHGDISQQQF